MDHFTYKNRILHCDDVPIPALAEKYGTPLYVYSKKTLQHHLKQLQTKTHAKTDTSVKGVKFGLDIDTVLEFAAKVVKNPHVKVVGLHMHLGSPIITVEPYRQGMVKGLVLIEKLRAQGHKITLWNM